MRWTGLEGGHGRALGYAEYREEKKKTVAGMDGREVYAEWITMMMMFR